MKSVLISIQPKWCELIANGKKLVEVRKTKPKLETPFKCYIYCTMGKDLLTISNGKVNKPNEIVIDLTNDRPIYELNGKVIGEFVCDNIDAVVWLSNPTRLSWENTYNKDSCLTDNELYNYSNGELFYKWHISDLVIYDEPRELSRFRKPCNHINDCCTCDRYDYIGHKCYDEIARPPQSWCYVEDLGEWV